MNIRMFYINSKLPPQEYTKIHISSIPQDIINKYNVMEYVDKDRLVYVKITGAMHGLSQRGRIAKKVLKIIPSNTDTIKPKRH